MRIKLGTFICQFPTIKGINFNSAVGVVARAVVNKDTELKDRFREIAKPLVTSRIQEKLLHLLARYRNVVALPGEPLGCTDLIHHIPLDEGTRSIYVPSYRFPHSQRFVVDKYIEDMLEQRVISRSMSSWNAPIFLVPKKKK